MRRRTFLQMAGASALAGTGVSAARAEAEPDYRRALVLVELKGANDALNTFVPYADPLYYRLRPRIAISRDDVLRLDAQLALHPSLAPLLPVWNAGELGIVQGLGYPRPNLSHFRSIEIWDTASGADRTLHDGWLARTFARYPAPRFAAEGVLLGGGDAGPFAGRRARAVALGNALPSVPSAMGAPAMQSGAPASALGHIMQVEANVARAARALRTDASLATPFPRHPFGQALRSAAQVLAVTDGVVAVRVSHGGYDTHQNQTGTHATLLQQLGEGLAALRHALIEVGRWESTLVMTYAEFGRRAAENGSGGTDHGTASTHMVLGGRVAGGRHGTAPALDALDHGNLVHTVDYRRYYATVLGGWWGIDPAPVLGAAFAPLELLRA